jgi:hypothetical protein
MPNKTEKKILPDNLLQTVITKYNNNSCKNFKTRIHVRADGKHATFPSRVHYTSFALITSETITLCFSFTVHPPKSKCSIGMLEIH